MSPLRLIPGPGNVKRPTTRLRDLHNFTGIMLNYCGILFNPNCKIVNIYKVLKYAKLK